MSKRKIDAGDEIHVYVSPNSVGAYLNADSDEYDEKDCSEMLSEDLQQKLSEEFPDVTVYANNYETSFASAGNPVNVMLDDDSSIDNRDDQFTELVSERVSDLFAKWCDAIESTTALSM